MRKLSLILLMLLAVITTFSSCKKDKEKIDKGLIVGKWQSTAGNYFEVYYSNGTGKMWDEDDDVYEDEADTFNWEFDSNNDSKFTQTIHFHSGAADLPQYCNIVTLDESSFVYNNSGWRRTENLKRVK